MITWSVAHLYKHLVRNTNLCLLFHSRCFFRLNQLKVWDCSYKHILIWPITVKPFIAASLLFSQDRPDRFAFVRWPLLLTWFNFKIQIFKFKFKICLLSIYRCNIYTNISRYAQSFWNVMKWGIHHKVAVEITYPFPYFNGFTVEVWEWTRNVIPNFTGHVITFPCLDWSQSMLRGYRRIQRKEICPIVRFRKVSNPRDLCLESLDGSEIWLASRQRVKTQCVSCIVFTINTASVPTLQWRHNKRYGV